MGWFCAGFGWGKRILLVPAGLGGSLRAAGQWDQGIAELGAASCATPLSLQPCSRAAAALTWLFPPDKGVLGQRQLFLGSCPSLPCLSQSLLLLCGWWHWGCPCASLCQAFTGLVLQKLLRLGKPLAPQGPSPSLGVLFHSSSFLGDLEWNKG